MQSSQIPYKFQEVWAAGAAAGYVNTPIPDTSSGANASQHLGFPPITATPIGSGGIPPVIGDFNGAFQYITQWLQWTQAGGGIVPYDSTLQTNIGGYPAGAYVASATTQGLIWRSTAENNTTNPDTGGAGWVRFFPGSNIAVYKVISGSQQVSINGAAFTTTGATTFAAIPNCAKVRIWGGGGGSGGASAGPSSSGPGGGGEYAEGIFAVTTSQTITVGAPGTAGTFTPTDGGDGGTSSFGSLITAHGGGRGFAFAGAGSGVPGSGGGGGTGGTFRQSGSGGSTGFVISGSAVYAGIGGASFGCGNGQPLTGTVAANGIAGLFPGQGATAAIAPTSAASGAIGASGVIIVEW